MPLGFSSAATAPASMVRKVLSTSSGFQLALTMTMGTGLDSMMRRVASNPSIFGMWMSIVTTSGLWISTMRTASSPSCAVPTTWMSGSWPSMYFRYPRTTGESSVMSTLIMRGKWLRYMSLLMTSSRLLWSKLRFTM
jgi:hypothetical protein